MESERRFIDQIIARRVQRQYTELPYPPVNPEDERRRFLTASTLDGIDRINDRCFGGRLDIQKGVRVLVAGAGTGESLVNFGEQLRYTPSEVVYLDISQPSMEIARQRANIRGLTNITWLQGSLLDLPQMDIGKFDFINCLGVLHHLENPQDGLNALTEVLRPDGAIGILVYGKYGRSTVYEIQETLKRLTTPDMSRQTKIAIARDFLATHPTTLDPFFLREIETDSGLHDLLLNEHDIPFTVPRIYNWLDSSGLELTSFTDARFGTSFAYQPELYLTDNERDKIATLATLGKREREALAEKLSGKIDLHSFYAMRPGYHSASSHDPEMVPSFAISINAPLRKRVTERCITLSGESLTIATTRDGRNINLILGDLAPTIFRYLDGDRSVDEVLTLAASETGIDKNMLQNEFSRIVDSLREAGWMVLRHKSIPPFITCEAIQKGQLERQGTAGGSAIVEDPLLKIIKKNVK